MVVLIGTDVRAIAPIGAASATGLRARRIIIRLRCTILHRKLKTSVAGGPPRGECDGERLFVFDARELYTVSEKTSSEWEFRELCVICVDRRPVVGMMKSDGAGRMPD